MSPKTPRHTLKNEESGKQVKSNKSKETREALPLHNPKGIPWGSRFSSNTAISVRRVWLPRSPAASRKLRWHVPPDSCSTWWHSPSHSASSSYTCSSGGCGWSSTWLWGWDAYKWVTLEHIRGDSENLMLMVFEDVLCQRVRNIRDILIHCEFIFFVLTYTLFLLRIYITKMFFILTQIEVSNWYTPRLTWKFFFSFLALFTPVTSPVNILLHSFWNF